MILQGKQPYLCKVPAADGTSPVGHVNAVRVLDQPVIFFDQVWAWIFWHRTIYVMKNWCFVTIHIQIIEPGARFSKEDSWGNLNKTVKHIYISRREFIA